MSDDINELCIGCNDIDAECDWEEWNSKKTPCPCSICLIKSMCKDSCESFKIYIGYGGITEGHTNGGNND